MNDFPPPRCVSDLITDLISSTDARFEAIATLFSVSHDLKVKAAFRENKEAIKGLVRVLEDIGKKGHVVRWETLAIIGELCRRDIQAVENKEIAKFNTDAEEIAARFVGEFPSLQKTLTTFEADQRTPGHEIAGDLLQALPFAGVTGIKTKAKDLLYLDGRLEQPWPRVTRAERTICKQCSKKATSPMRCSACKSVFYCSAECQQTHWKAGHKKTCKTFKAEELNDPLAYESKLFLPTRPQIFHMRNKMLANVTFEQYFFEYTQPAEVLPEDVV